MGKLHLSTPRLKGSGHRLGLAAAGVQPATARPWKAWYKTAEWRALRRRVFVRDHYTCQKCGRICVGRHPDDASPVADHIEAHRGDRARFFDEANVHTLCKSPCHDQVKQAEEQATRHHIGVWD